LLNTGKDSSLLYPYITMNKLPKYHRAVLIDMLAKNNIVNNGLVIWREPTQLYEFKYWKEKIQLLDQKEKFVNQEVVPQEYTNSLIQLVAESDPNVFILSEKVAIPLFFNKPFIVAGSAYYHETLKQLGFKLYDELFDYKFDLVHDLESRYDLIAKNLIKFVGKSSLEMKRIYDSVFEKCVYNKKVALRLATNSDLIPNIWQTLVEHQSNNNIHDYPDTINNFIRSRENEFRF